MRYFGVDQGLSNNSVTSICQDKYGFVWFGTNDGLNSFDGARFKTYRNIWGNSSSLINNHVTVLAANNDKIFVGTQGGLDFFSYSDSKFHKPYFYSVDKKQRIGLNTNINSIVADKDGNVYIASDHWGLLVYNDKLGHCKRIAFKNEKTSYNVQALALGPHNKIWLFIRGVGLCYYDPKHDQINTVNRSLNVANCIEYDRVGNLWIGTENGLFQFIPSTGAFRRLDELSHKLSNDNIFDIRQDRSGRIWIATNGGGVNVLSITQSIDVIQPTLKAGSLKSGAVTSLLEDKDGRMWMGSLRGGVNIIDNKKEVFKLIGHDPFNSNSVRNNFIDSFCEDGDNIWIGTSGAGVSCWNRPLNRFENFVHSTDPSSLKSNFVVSIIKDFKGQIWLGSFNGGIDLYNRQSKSFKRYQCYNTFTKTEDKNLWKLYEDSSHNLWAGTTAGGGLYLYNRTKDRFELFHSRLTNIHALFEDAEGSLWAGSYSFLYQIDVRKRTFKSKPVSHSVRSIVEDKNRRGLWIGTEGGGLVYYNKTTGKIKRYTQADGLPSNSLLSILTDNNGDLWCSTFDGLAKFNPVTHKVKAFSVSDGLQSNQFCYNAALKLRSGELLFGGINGFNIFHPDSVAGHFHTPPLRLTGLRVGGLDVEGSSDYTGNTPVVNLKKLVVPFNEATISVDYTAIEFDLPDKINYAYYLEGWDRGWNYVGKLKTAYYTRLNEGKYTLHIKTTNSDGSWSNKQMLVSVLVLPPWYRTIWAYFIYLCIITIILYYIWLYQTRQTRLKYEVQIANLRVEQEKELNERKLAFFTNISHEFRTPLTLIINPIKDLLDKEKGSELNLIYRNAKRLLGLVDHLLLFRKAESENDTLKLSRLNLSELCNDVFQCFIQLAKSKNIEYTFVCSNSGIELYADREKMEIVLFNLLSNALKFTPSGGRILMSVEEDEAEIVLKISDSGCGISPNVGERLFTKFYQVKDKNSLKTGFGIGLYLVKSFIENHKGQISYVSNENEGTTFFLKLKKGQTHFDGYKIDEVADEAKQPLEYVDVEQDGNEVEEEDAFKNLGLLISDKQSVLVIDDNKQMRDYIRKIFQVDFIVHEAENGEEGFKTIKKHLPDIVVSDINMDGLSGIELCKAIKQDTSLSHIPVILLTGDATPDIKLKSIEVGAVDFVNKPFEKDLMVARVKGILKSKKDLQNYFYNEITLKANPRSINEEHKDFLYKCIAIIEANLLEPKFDVMALSKQMGMSYSSLYKRLKIVTDGQSVNAFVRYVRLRKAAELLVNTNCKINEAAYSTGFTDIKYFREQFAKQFGVNPSDFIKKHRAAFHKSYLFTN